MEEKVAFFVSDEDDKRSRDVHGDSGRKVVIAVDELKGASSKRQGWAEVSHFGNTIYPSRSQKMNEPCEVEKGRKRLKSPSLSLPLSL